MKTQGAVARRTKNRQRLGPLVAAVVIVLILAFPAFSGNSYDLGRVQLGMVYVLVALGLNVAYGLAGEFTLGHVAIMAVGAYSAGILTAHAGWNLWIALLAAVIIGMLASLALGAPSVRVRGAYLGLLTLFAVLAIPPLVTLGEEWTGGEYGLLGIPLVEIGGLDPTTATYLVTAVFLILVVLGLRNLIKSSWGMRFSLLRDAPRAAESVGFNNLATKLIAYAVYGAVAALAGALMAYNDGTVVGSTFNVNLTLIILTGVVLGGRGTLWGPVLGTIPLILLSFYVGPFSETNPIIFGAVLVLAVMLFPNGIVTAFTYEILPAVRERGFAGWLRSLLPNRGAGIHAPQQEEIAAEDLERGSVPDNVLPFNLITPGADKKQTDNEPLLEVSQLRKSFGGVAALDGVDLTVEKGQIVGLVGQNGCGKSTLLNMISGFYTPDSGTVRIGGEQTTGNAPHAIARRGVGRTFQVPRLVDRATVADNISAGLIGHEPSRFLSSVLALPVARREARLRRKQAVEMVQILGLERDAADVLANSLPLGVKRIVEVGRAAVAWPSLLLLDEPAAGLNDEERGRLSNTVKALARAGITPIVVEHNIEFVLDLCDTVVLMESGSVCSVYRTNDPDGMPQRMVDYLQYSKVG
jgi:branched-chain amino acid transport system permease protein